MTQEALEQLARDAFANRGRSPQAWRTVALALHRSALLLWGQVDAARDDAARWEYLDLLAVAMMLGGMAIETLAKAMLVHGKPESVHEGEWKGPKTHTLVDLISATPFRAIAEEERAVLLDLSAFVAWAGRYPIPLESSKLTATLKPQGPGKWPEIEFAPGTWISIENRANFEALFAALDECLVEMIGAEK